MLQDTMNGNSSVLSILSGTVLQY